MSIDLNENYYVAICDNGHGKCHISEDYYRKCNIKERQKYGMEKS